MRSLWESLWRFFSSYKNDQDEQLEQSVSYRAKVANSHRHNLDKDQGEDR